MASEYNYRQFKGSVGYVEVRNKEGDPGIGSAFHLGDGVFATARHVVEGKTVVSMGTTVPYKTPVVVDPSRGLNEWKNLGPFTGKPKDVLFTTDDSDVALLVFPEGAALPALRLGEGIVDRFDDELVLDSATIMGYPRVPLVRDPPVLLAVRCEINAVVDKYTDGHRYLIVSSMARGGFSGGPVIHNRFNPVVVGLITESRNIDEHPPELGFMVALSVEPILRALEAHALTPTAQRAG